MYTAVYPETLATCLIWRFGGHAGSESPNFYHQMYIDLLTMLCPCFSTANLISAGMKLQPDLVEITNLNDRKYFQIYSIQHA